MAAWLDCKAIKHRKAILPIECLSFHNVCLVCLIHTAPDNLPLDRILHVFSISQMIPLALLLVWEHWESMKTDMRKQKDIRMTHWQLITLLKESNYWGAAIPLFCPSSSPLRPPALPVVVSARITRWGRIRVVHILLSVSPHSPLLVVDRACLA